MADNEEMVTVCLRVSPELRRKLDEISDETGASISWIVRKAIEADLAEREVRDGATK